MEKKSQKKLRWLIVLGAHITMIICGGTYRSFGVFLVELKKYFETSLTLVSGIGSVLAGSFIVAGLVSGPLITRCGSPVATFIGAMIMMTGTIASVFAQSAFTLCFTVGIFIGIGVGIAYTSAQVIAAHHFKKGYSKANSLISSGAGVGIVVIPPLLQLGIDYYDWRGTMLLLAGVQAQLIVVSLIFRLVNIRKSSNTSTRGTVVPEKRTDSQSLVHQPLTGDGTENPSHDVEARNHIINNAGHDKQNSEVTELSTQECETAREELVEKGRDDSNLSKDTSSTQGQRQTSRCYRLLKLSGWGLFRESVGFTLLMICQVSQGICYTTIMVHFVASAVYAGIGHQSAAFLLSVVGIGSITSRLVNGWFIDRKLIQPEHLYILSMAVFGGSTILSRASSSYGWLVFIAVLLGLSSGVFKCLLVVVLRKYVGVDNLAAAMGVGMVFMAAGDLIGPVFAGALYDAAESYNVPFFVAGTTLIGTACLLFLERPLSRRREKHRLLKSAQEDKNDEKTENV